MIHFKTRMTSLMLVFGIFFTLSCSTLSLTNESAESLYERGKFDKALTSVNNSLEENPDDSEIKVLKAKILKEVALDKQNPSDRKVYYQNMRDVVDDVRFTTDQAQTDSILVNAWSHEQSEGVRHLQEDNTDTYETNFDRIISHLENASVIIPDSLITYSLKATTYYRHGDIQKAISSIEQAENNGVSLTPQIRERLAFLYLESGNLQKSISTYKDLVDQHPNNQNYRHGLVNALILDENHEESVAYLLELSEEYPNRTEYVEALASERFYKISQEIDSFSATDKSLTSDEFEALITELSEIGNLFKSIESDRPARESHQFRVASFYSKSGRMLLDLQDITEEELEEKVETRAEEFFEYSLPYWQQLTESHPENRDYLQKLYEAYTFLEMQDEAEMLEQQINF